jgi:hypothetical protein
MSISTISLPTFSTSTGSILATGDVIEFDRNGDRVTGLVLLASGEHVIIDLVDEDTVFVSRLDELDNPVVFGEFLERAA